MKNGAFFVSWIPVAVSAAFFVVAFLLFSGCYTLKQGAAMLGYLGKAVPLESLSGQAEDERRFAERVADIRRFAMEELGLKESKNYTRYVAIDRDYLAAVVSACAPDSFTRHEWRFPVVGTVPYKGLFDPNDARKEAAKLRADGLDVWIRGVDAFSTLGWFRDPLYSYMKEYPVHALADLIIHELLHATVFIKGQVQFNEQLAEFVGSTGAGLYMESRFGIDSPEYREIDAGAADRTAFRGVVSALIAELEVLYAGNLSREEKLSEKARIIKVTQERFASEYDDLFSGENYRNFAELPVNNAYLDLYRLYYEEDNFLQILYQENCEPTVAGLRRFVDAAKTLTTAGRWSGDLRKQLETRLRSTPVPEQAKNARENSFHLEL
ncbi:MAG: aminopeptidase [Treponema sp.]|jgi:predicted aminopeptidase|nr:aminopeptidase [Treponema sp.]